MMNHIGEFIYFFFMFSWVWSSGLGVGVENRISSYSILSLFFGIVMGVIFIYRDEIKIALDLL